jgi:hypothetical protein
MRPEETFRQLLMLGEGLRFLEARLEASSPTLLLKIEGTMELWREESLQADTPVICHGRVEPIQEAPQRLQQRVRDRVCSATWAPGRRQQGVSCDPAVVKDATDTLPRRSECLIWSSYARCRLNVQARPSETAIR